MLNKQALVHQLISMRAAIDAALILLTDEEAPEEAMDDGCRHPKERRLNYPSGGWMCRDCGFTPEEANG